MVVSPGVVSHCFFLVFCKIKETLFIQELEQAFNVNVGSEKLMLYYFALVFFLHLQYFKSLLNIGSRPLTAIMYK